MIVSNSTLIVNDILKPVIKLDMDEKKEVFASRLLIVVCSLIVFYFAMYQRSILTVVTVGLALSVGYFFTLIISWYFPRLARKSTAFALIACSCVTSAAWFIFPWFSTKLPHVLYLHLITCAIVFLFTLLDKRPAFFLTDGYKIKYGQNSI